jgi:energy-coupling factor transporter ATP-binding protein EcfA2
MSAVAFTDVRKAFGAVHALRGVSFEVAAGEAHAIVGEPGTGKSWLSEHLAAAVSGCSTLTIQGTAGTTEDQIKYSWNIARVIAEGPKPGNLIASPTMLAMRSGALVRFEEITRCVADVQDSLVSILSDKAIAIPELPDVRYLPLAAAGRRHREPCSSEELAPYRTAISFVGNSLAAETSALERALQHAGWAPALQQRVERWLQELADRAGRDASLGKLSPDDLPDWLPIESVDDSARFADLFDGRLAALHRSQVVRALSPLQIAVYGDPGWSRVAAGYRGPAGHGDELTKIYRASAVNLDIPRLYQRDIVTLRAFDVMAAGGALLTESASELSSLVPPGCMATYDSTEELVSRAEHLTTHPEQARDMAQAGRECIIREHLLEHRVTRLLDACRERGWIA